MPLFDNLTVTRRDSKAGHTEKITEKSAKYCIQYYNFNIKVNFFWLVVQMKHLLMPFSFR